MSRFTTAPVRVLIVTVLACAIPLASLAQATTTLGKKFHIQVPLPPTPVKVNAKLQLVYELHFDNQLSDTVALTRVAVLTVDEEASVLGDFRGAQLSSLVGLTGARPDPMHRREVGPGKSGVVYFWLPLDSAAVPRKLTHRIEFDVIRGNERESALAQGGEFTVRTVPPVALDPPLRGGPWAAVYDPSMERGHRRVQIAVQQRARIPARFAIDWFKVDEDGKVARGDDSKVANWYGYGAEVLAVADSIVADTRDGVPESPSLAGAPANTLENASGNYVVLDLGQGRYAFYEHLKPGSVAVKAGDHVQSGQVIAALGYTGDSTGPHLHFHVSDANSTLAAEGLPYVFGSFDARGAFESIEAFAESKPWLPLPNGTPAARKSELPAANAVVMFRTIEPATAPGR